MIDQKTIAHMAHLARLKITPEESALYQEQLAKVLSHFDHISEINTDGIEPLVTPSEIELYLRPDEATKEFTTEEMLSNSPENTGHLFKVPPVV